MHRNIDDEVPIMGSLSCSNNNTSNKKRAPLERLLVRIILLSLGFDAFCIWVIIEWADLLKSPGDVAFHPHWPNSLEGSTFLCCLYLMANVSIAGGVCLTIKYGNYSEFGFLGVCKVAMSLGVLMSLVVFFLLTTFDLL